MKDKKKVLTVSLILVVILIIGSIIYVYSGFNGDMDDDDLGTISTGSTGSGDVRINMRPVSSDDVLVFEVSMDTHTVNLEEHDLMEQSYLHVDGEVYEPISAPTLFGHHVTGDLEFNVDYELNDGLRVIIEDIPAVDERIFEW